jgi:hypothetical protein
MMEFNSRRDRFSYFLGFVARTQDHLLREVEKSFSERGYPAILPDAVFEVCPFNDNWEQILRSYKIFENGKRSELAPRLITLVEEFLFLVSDFEPPCCGDGRAFYERSLRGEIVLVCDRCGAAYSLDGKPIQERPRHKMARQDFIDLFGEDTAEDWPYHAKLRDLLASSPV